MSSYDRWAADYDAWSGHMTDDLDWYVGLAREAAEPIVELGVGTGRVAISIARETGKRVIGIDASPGMLAVARERAGDLPVELRECDMRDLELDEPVELVICPFRSLMHLPTWADRRRVFERVAAALRPGGRFAWNAFACSPAIVLRLHDRRIEHPDGLWEVSHFAPADSRVDLTLGRGEEALGTESAWWLGRSEWEGLIDVAGLEVEALHGGFHREPFEDDSLEFVWIARRPA